MLSQNKEYLGLPETGDKPERILLLRLKNGFD